MTKTLQAAQVPGTDVTVRITQVDDLAFPFRVFRTASATLRVKEIDAGFATEEWARQAARSTWAEVVRIRDAKTGANARTEKVAALIAPVPSAGAAAARLRFGGSEKQEAFMRSLLADLEKLAPQRTAEERFNEMVEKGQTVTVRKTSEMIDLLLATVKELRAAARAAAPAPVADTTPTGYFAVEYNGLLGFYHLQTSKNPAYAGRVFVNRFHSDDESYVGKSEGDFVKAAIVADTDGTRARFAEESEHCWMCGRRLTDVKGARARGGIGPECVKKL